MINLSVTALCDHSQDALNCQQHHHKLTIHQNLFMFERVDAEVAAHHTHEQAEKVLNVEGDSSSKQYLFCQGNITAVVFPKQLKLSVTNCTHSALTSFEIRLACDSLLKSQKPCQGFTETLLRF